MTRRDLLIAASVVLLGGALIGFLGPADPFQRLRLTAGYAVLLVISLLGLLVLINLALGKLDIGTILAEHGGGASMSRFQLLIFTLVIAFSFLIIVAATGQFPDRIPTDVLTLLGISASTYGVSKGIQASSGLAAKAPALAEKAADRPDPVADPPQGNPAG